MVFYDHIEEHMIEEVQVLLDRYVAWLKDKSTLRQIDDWVQITTPYLDRHNDYLQIYAKRQNGRPNAFRIARASSILAMSNLIDCNCFGADIQSILNQRVYFFDRVG